ncbi:MAG TPA: DUF4838 domain-containing protein, partial [Nitrospirales bacterium]|nr:DUF4838 domain-containing protein [Nitrospirales bacterium]
EGYVIRTVGTRLVIAGGEPRGTLYGVYALLEDHFGCKWFTPDISHIPEHPSLTLGQLDETRIPELEYREPFVFDAFDGDWCARNRMNSSSGRLEEKHGGKVRFGAGMFVHTFNTLVPPNEHFDTHPEYFSLVNGARLKERSQLCTTNEDVVQLCIQQVTRAIKSDPDAFVYSVSQNDWHNYCECEACTALADEEGTWMAPVLYLVNRVAEAIESEYPDKAIETLAYQYTRKAPRTMRPRANVIIRLCSIEACFMHPLNGCDSPENIAFAADARDWAKVSERLWVWDYVTSFGHYMAPFPNLRVRDDNIRFFIENNVVGIFEQDAYQSFNGEFSSLSGYLNAKLLWDKDYDEDQAINEFLIGVYGEASEPIRAYIDLLHDKVRDDNIHLGIWIGPQNSPFLTEDVMAKSEQLWDEAEALVETQPGVSFRVRTARLCHDYAWLEKNRYNTDMLYQIDHANFTAKPHSAFGDRVQQFFKTAHEAKVTLLGEGRQTLDEYEEDFTIALMNSGKTFVPVDSVMVAIPTQGLRYATHIDHEETWESLPDFATLTQDSQGITPKIDADISDRPQYFAARFSGYFNAEHDGVYSFSLGSNDGSKLSIAGKTLDSDGLHAVLELNLVVGLKKGFHPINIEYFQSGGTKELYLKTAGPKMEYGSVPASMLYHDAE